MTTMTLSMQELIAKIGAGQKASKDLTWEEAKQAMRLLIEGRATPAQVGAFLLAMRFKMESVTELAAFTSTARTYAPPLPVPQGLALVDLPVYAGKQDTFHASIGAAVVAAAGGAAILMHGHDIIPHRPGPAGVLAKLGIATELAPKQAADELAAKGFAYIDVALYHPSVAKFLDLRLELGVRNLFHPVARMLNPARAKAQIIGLTHPPYFEKTAETLAMLGDAGLPAGTHQPMAGFAPGQTDKEADLLKKILSNQVRGGQRDWVLLNAAMLLYAADRATSFAAGAKLAQQALDSGDAAKKLSELATEVPVA